MIMACIDRTHCDTTSPIRVWYGAIITVRTSTAYTGDCWPYYSYADVFSSPPLPPPKWWRWFDVFRIPLRYAFAVVTAPAQAPAIAARVHPIAERRRWKRRRYLQALRTV